MAGKATSKLLASIPVEEILSPQPLPFEWGGKRFDILPMPDSSQMVVADCIGDVVAVLDQLAVSGFAGLTPAEVLPYVPAVVRALLPASTRLIAASLGVDEDLVAERMPLYKKLEALTLIVRAENLPAILAGFASLAGQFALQPAAPAGPPAAEPTPTQTATDRPSTAASSTT